MIDRTTKEWLEHFEKLKLKAFDNYQSTGEERYDNAQEKYDVICDGLRALLEKKEEYDGTIKKRLTNCQYVIERLGDGPYSRNEVIKLLRDAVYW